MNPLAIVLAISLLANAGLTYIYLGARDDVAAADSLARQAKSAAQTCSDSVDQLQLLARDNAAKSRKAIAAAAARATTADQRADDVLSTPATVPGNDCRSAQDRASKWLRTRK